jgi:hypothetical protein
MPNICRVVYYLAGSPEGKPFPLQVLEQTVPLIIGQRPKTRVYETGGVLPIIVVIRPEVVFAEVRSYAFASSFDIESVLDIEVPTEDLMARWFQKQLARYTIPVHLSWFSGKWNPDRAG